MKVCDGHLISVEVTTWTEEHARASAVADAVEREARKEDKLQKLRKASCYEQYLFVWIDPLAGEAFGATFLMAIIGRLPRGRDLPEEIDVVWQTGRTGDEEVTEVIEPVRRNEEPPDALPTPQRELEDMLRRAIQLPGVRDLEELVARIPRVKTEPVKPAIRYAVGANS